MLDQLNRLKLPFIKPFLDPQYFWAWLAQRDMRDPWLEGNNIVNIGSSPDLESNQILKGPAGAAITGYDFLA